MSASWMLVFLMPAEVRRYFMIPLLVDFMGAERLLQALALILKQNDPRTERLRFYQVPDGNGTLALKADRVRPW
jgi:hypothetical protein